MPSTATAPAATPQSTPSATSVMETAQVPPATVLMPEFDALAHHQEIAQLAYQNWLERADGPGSAEEDWLRAEREVRAKHSR